MPRIHRFSLDTTKEGKWTRVGRGWMQVCLAAEKCGHLDFDIRRDMWWRAQGFHCGDTPAGEVSFADVFWKVPNVLCRQIASARQGCVCPCGVSWFMLCDLVMASARANVRHFASAC